MSTLPDVSGTIDGFGKGKMPKGYKPELIFLGHGVKNDMTVIAGWSAI